MWITLWKMCKPIVNVGVKSTDWLRNPQMSRVFTHFHIKIFLK